jgi:hypothetical protein
LRALASLAALLILAAGCPLEPRVVDLRPDTGSGPGDSALVSEIGISSSDLDFGDVAVGEHHEKSVEIFNIGQATLQILEVEVSEQGSPFSFEQLETAWIEPSQSAILTLAFEPITHGHANGTLNIRSDDPDQPVLSVDLNGQGLAPALSVEPGELALGPSWIGCSVTERLVLVNEGNAGLRVDAVDFESATDELQLDLATLANGALPWTLGAESTLELGTVSYAPEDERDDYAYLTIGTSDDRIDALRVDVWGQGRAWDSVRDRFVVPLGTVDVLLAVDRSSSMDGFVEGLLAALPALVSGLDGQGMDLRLAAVVDDDGCVNGDVPWLDGGGSASQNEDAIAAMIAPDGSATLSERAFLLLQAATDASNLGAGGCNEGLIREHAAIHLIGVSDEPEQSSGVWSDHVASLQALHSDPSQVVFHAIAGDDDGCGLGAYEGFEDAVDLSGGAMLSLCSEDLAGELADLAFAIAALAGPTESAGPYALTQQPVVASIELRVDDATVTEGWSYDSDSNSVSFEPVMAPSPGASVEVRYASRPQDCDQRR